MFLWRQLLPTICAFAIHTYIWPCSALPGQCLSSPGEDPSSEQCDIPSVRTWTGPRPHPNVPPNVRTTRNNGRGFPGPNLQADNYQIMCGTSRKNTVVAKALAAAMSALRPVIAELWQSHPEHGYSQLFGPVRNSQAIRRNFQVVLEGSPFGKADHIHNPTIYCATPEMDVDYNMDMMFYERCIMDPFLTAFTPRGQGFVILCPRFFHFPAASTVPHCPTWDERKGRFTPGQPDTPVTGYQAYILIRELVRGHLGATALGTGSTGEEAVEWNLCLDLYFTRSYRNPSSYELFTAREY